LNSNSNLSDALVTRVGFGASSPECRWLYARGVHV
jgi:hypothetical protein